MSEESFDFQCTVLPKGLDGEHGLRVTLALAPHAQAIGPNFNLPTVLRGLQDLSLFIADGAPEVPGVRIATASFGDEHKRVLDPGLWAKLMSGVQANPAAARARLGASAAATPPAGAAWRTSHAVSIVEALNRRTVPSVATAKAAQNGAQPRLAPLRRSHALAWPTASVKRTTAKGAVTPDRADLDPLAMALQHAHRLFVHTEDTVDALADRLNDLKATSPEDREWQRLLAGYSTERNKSPGELLLGVGLRPNQATVEWLRRRIRAARGQPAEQTFGDVVLDQLLFSAPHVPNGAARDGALKAQADADDASMENRLAALANEFVLHPMLGLSIDLVFTCTIPAADLRARLGRDQVRIRVDVGMQPAAHQPWTMLTPDAWPLPRGNDASVFDPGADGWCRMDATVLSNQDSRSSIARWRSALVAGLAGHPGVADGIRPVQVTPPPMQTSALVLQLPALSQQTSQVVLNGGLQGRNPERLNLEDLVVGIRPMLEVTDTRDRRFAAALLGREIDYPDIAPATQALATRLAGPPQSRDEGHIPVMRLSDPGEKQDGTAHLVATEQVFEWNGWNPAVPLPGAPMPPRSAQSPRLERLKKTIVARPGENLPYRYGLAVRASCRWVLRDGSSRLPAAVAAGADDAPWVGGGFILKRHEPLRAPMVLRQPDDIRTPLLEFESATKVVLASLLDGHNVREASVRYVLPGAIRDLIDLDRHAVFDKGLPPTATAYPRFARGMDSAAPDKPESIFAVQGTEPMVVIQPEQPSVAKTKLFHPDPMTTRLRLVLVRTTVAMGGTLQQWYPVVDAHGQPLLAEFSLYDHQPWPWSLALKVTFEARRRGDKQTLISSRPAVDGILPVRVGVPAGERYTLMVLPIGDPERLSRQHQFGGGSDVYDPQLSQITTIDVQHVLQRPEPAVWTNPIAPPSRQVQERAADLKLEFELDPGSTTQVDLHAGWTDPIDDPLRGLPMDQSRSDTPQSSMLVATLGQLIGPASDAQIDDAGSNLALRPPVRLSPQVRHDMPDTRRRRFGYRLTTAGSNLLSDWEAKQPGHGPVATSTDSATQWITVPASAPPLQPDLREIQLAFKFERATFLTTSVSDRTCAMSLVMERGWWSSGPGEKLAIVISPVLGPDGKTPVQSTWAADPIRRSAQPFMPNLAKDDFAAGPQVEVIEVTAGQHATLVLFEPLFDELADAWRVDVVLNVADFQMQPFVQLVLARYQPEAVLGASLSQIVVADFFQLPSRRSATVKFLENETEAVMEVAVTGAVDLAARSDPERAAQSEAGVPRLWAVVQRTVRAGVGASVWIDTPCTAALLPDSSSPGGRQVARINVPPHERRGGVRVAIFEQTEFQTGIDATCAFGPMHYFDVLPMDLFEPPPPG